jgi:hypothetical protein
MESSVSTRSSNSITSNITVELDCEEDRLKIRPIATILSQRPSAEELRVLPAIQRLWRPSQPWNCITGAFAKKGEMMMDDEL